MDIGFDSEDIPYNLDMAVVEIVDSFDVDSVMVVVRAHVLHVHHTKVASAEMDMYYAVAVVVVVVVIDYVDSVIESSPKWIVSSSTAPVMKLVKLQSDPGNYSYSMSAVLV